MHVQNCAANTKLTARRTGVAGPTAGKIVVTAHQAQAYMVMHVAPQTTMPSPTSCGWLADRLIGWQDDRQRGVNGKDIPK